MGFVFLKVSVHVPVVRFKVKQLLLYFSPPSLKWGAVMASTLLQVDKMPCEAHKTFFIECA